MNPIAQFLQLKGQAQSPQQGSIGGAFQLARDYSSLGMSPQNAFSQNPQQINPLGAFFMQNKPQYGAMQNIMQSQQSAQPPMGSIMGVGQSQQAQPTQQRSGLGFFGGMFGG